MRKIDIFYNKNVEIFFKREINKQQVFNVIKIT